MPAGQLRPGSQGITLWLSQEAHAARPWHGSLGTRRTYYGWVGGRKGQRACGRGGDASGTSSHEHHGCTRQGFVQSAAMAPEHEVDLLPG